MRRFTVLVLSVSLGMLVLVPVWNTRGDVAAAPAFVIPPGTLGTPQATPGQTPTVTGSPVIPTSTPNATVAPTNTPNATVVPTTTACAGGAFVEDQTNPASTPCPTTPIPTATAPPPVVPTATTSPPMGAPARIVARATLRHLGKSAVIRWRMAYALGIKGFRIYANHRLLTHNLIRPHRSANYVARVAWVAGQPYRLVVLFQNGRSRGIPVR